MKHTIKFLMLGLLLGLTGQSVYSSANPSDGHDPFFDDLGAPQYGQVSNNPLSGEKTRLLQSIWDDRQIEEVVRAHDDYLQLQPTNEQYQTVLNEALRSAVYFNNTDAVEFFLSKGADMHASTPDDRSTAFTRAHQEGVDPRILEILKHRAMADKRDIIRRDRATKQGIPTWKTIYPDYYDFGRSSYPYSPKEV